MCGFAGLVMVLTYIASVDIATFCGELIPNASVIAILEDPELLGVL